MRAILRSLCVSIVTLLAAAACLGAETARPNILFLFSDDQRADTIGAWGNEIIRTPHLDRLARRGLSFRGNYCFGANSGAVCVPSRAMLMTGKTWFDIRHDLAGEKLLPEVLREAGYRTFATGKWHNGAESLTRAFPEACSMFLGGMADHTKVEVCDVVAGKLGEKRIAARFSSEEFAEKAIEFLKTASNSSNGDEPFFCYVAFTAPHDPRNPPEDFRELYYEDPPPAPKNFMPLHPFDNGILKNVRDENLAAYPRDEATIRSQLAEYYGLITHLDAQIGRILNSLAGLGLEENTIVVFAADSGLAMGSHGLLGKQSVYEHSMRSPLIVAGPAIPEAKRGDSTNAFSYLFDLTPTIYAWAGATPPGTMAGFDLNPLIRGEVARHRDSVFLPFTDLMRAVRDERFKLIVYPQINHRQLFDLVADPDETNDLADNAEHRPTIDRMMAKMQAWQTTVGDKQPLAVDNPRPPAIRFDDFSRQPDQWQPEWIVDKYFR